MFFVMESKLSFPLSCILFLFLFVSPVFSHFQYPHLQPNEVLNNSTHPSPFGFLKNVQGCHKGEKVKGIHDLKLYLSYFGYLNYQNNPNVTNPKEDHFDEELERAIKSYQVYYHLNATGTLDAPTVSKMAMPRCGFPDKETHQHSDKSLHTVSHYRFFPGRPKWPKGKRHLTYAFGSRFPTRFMPPVARAFKKWATASRYFTFSRAKTYRSADLKISFARQAHGDGAPFDGPGGVLAHAFAPTDGRLHYDADDRWVVGAVPNAYDIETLALHEIGHLLGLGHSQYPNAIMWATFKAGVTKGLNSDDIRGLRALYDSYGEHAVHCRELPGFKYRHDLVRDVLFDIFRRAGVSTKKEAPVNFLTDPLDGRSTLRPADILVFGWIGGKHACVDLTGGSPLVGLGVSAFTVSQAALKAVSSKVTKHEKACLDNQHVFIPFAFDTFGFLAPEVVELLNRVQRVMHSNVMTPRSVDVVFKRLGFAIQKGLTAQLVARLPFISM